MLLAESVQVPGWVVGKRRYLTQWEDRYVLHAGALVVTAHCTFAAFIAVRLPTLLYSSCISRSFVPFFHALTLDKLFPAAAFTPVTVTFAVT